MRIFLAPMEGVVDHHMRKLLGHVGGIDICVTEFIRVTDHLLPRKVFLRYCPELDRKHCKLNGHPSMQTRVQLLGSNPVALASNANKAAQLGAPAIDLNFGCPAKTVNKNKGGACLLNETDTIFEIVSNVRNAVPKHIPVTAKIRLGYEERNSFLRNAKAIEEAGANEIIVHARSKADGYKPPAYWDCIRQIKETLDIPVVANGEIWTVQDYLRCKEVSGCDDIMIGRGLLARPDLAKAIKKLNTQPDLNPAECYSLAWPDIAKYLYELFADTRNYYPKKYLGNRVKQWLHYLKLTYPEANSLFNGIKKTREEAILEKALIAQL